MIKQYKNLRHTIEQLRWGTGLNKLDEIFYKDCKLQIRSFKTAKKFILKRCAWYYKYKDLFSDHLGVNPPIFIKSKQPIHCNWRVIDDFEIERYDQDLKCGCKGLSNFYLNGKNDKNKSDSFSFYSFLLQIT